MRAIETACFLNTVPPVGSGNLLRAEDDYTLGDKLIFLGEDLQRLRNAWMNFYRKFYSASANPLRLRRRLPKGTSQMSKTKATRPGLIPYCYDKSGVQVKQRVREMCYLYDGGGMAD